MKHLLTLAAALTITVGAFATEKNVTVKVTNPSSEARKNVPVVLQLDGTTVSALVTVNGKEIPCQLDDLNDDGKYEELAFVTDLPKKEKQTVNVVLSDQGQPRQYPPKTYGYMGIRDRQPKNPQHQQIKSFTFPKETNPYNYIYPHGPVMENELVGFRVYADYRQSLDYYGHRNFKMDVAETGFYTTQAQRDKGYGEDVLYTGSTYGCGALHGWDGKNAVMFQNARTRTQTVVCDGPVRCILDITNRGWMPYDGCKPTDILTRYTLWAGHRDVQVDVKFSRAVADIPLSTGITDIVEGSTEFTDHEGLRGDWGRACAGNNPQVYDTITVGLGVYVPKQYYKSDSHFTDGKSHLPNQAYVEVVGTDSDNLHYWFASTCDIETFGFKDDKGWFAWLKEWKKELSKPTQITVE